MTREPPWGIFPGRNRRMQPRSRIRMTGAMRRSFRYIAGSRISGIEPATLLAGDTPNGFGKGAEHLP